MTNFHSYMCLFVLFLKKDSMISMIICSTEIIIHREMKMKDGLPLRIFYMLQKCYTFWWVIG